MNEKILTKSYFLFLRIQINEWNQMSYIAHIIQLLGYFSVSKNWDECFFFSTLAHSLNFLAFHFLLASKLMCVDGIIRLLFLLFHSVHGSQSKNTKVVCRSLLQWTMFCQNSQAEPSVLGGPARNDSYILAIVFILFSDSIIFALGLFPDFSSCHVTESKHPGKYLILTYRWQ